MDSTFTAFDVLVLLAGAVWLLKKVTEGNHDHGLRVFVLTAVLGCIALYFFHCISVEAGFLPRSFSCVDYP